MKFKEINEASYFRDDELVFALYEKLNEFYMSTFQDEYDFVLDNEKNWDHLADAVRQHLYALTKKAVKVIKKDMRNGPRPVLNKYVKDKKLEILTK